MIPAETLLSARLLRILSPLSHQHLGSSSSSKLGRMAQTQHGCTASVCTASVCLAHLIFLWLCASAQKSPPLHADTPVFACVVPICKYLAAASHPLLTPSWVCINMRGSPETRRDLHICKMSLWMGAFWNKTNHPLDTLNTAGVTRERCRSWRCSSRWGPSLHEVFHVALGNRALEGSGGADGNTVLSSPSFSS